MTRAPLLLLLFLAAGGCKLDTSFGGTTYQCGVPERCPDGFSCVDGLCREGGGGDGDAGDAGDPDATPGPRVSGDLLLMTFDDRNQPLLWDRSGGRRDAHEGGADPVAGRYGGGVALDPDDAVFIADAPSLFAGSTITIEAWIQRDQGSLVRGIFGDHTINDDVPAEASLEIDASDHLVFLTNHNCAFGGVAVTSTATVPVATWTHVAVAWDGETARFYVDGEDAGESALTAMPCELPNPHRIGRRSGDPMNAALTGLVDEVKVSSVAKSQEDIQASMAFDSTALFGACGDGIVEAQDCEPSAFCCRDNCVAPADGVSCAGSEGTCDEGVCAIDGGRVTAGIAALYLFDEGSGTTVSDSSGILPAIDLTIADEATVDWVNGGLDILSDSIIEASAALTTRLVDACNDSDEVTLELWITPETANAHGKIAFLSSGNSDVDVGLMQIGEAYLGKVHSAGSTDDGVPAIDSAVGDGRTSLTHVVLTRADSGERRVYVDGRLRSSNTVRGALGWVDRVLAIGDQSGDDDPWVGTFHLMAIYHRALSAADVARNFTAGP